MTTETLLYPTLIDALKAAAVKLRELIEGGPEPLQGSESVAPQIPLQLPSKIAKVPAKFASPGDVATRHVTLNISDLVRAGFFGKPHNLVRGDRIQTMVNGVFTEWKVNRKTARTAAAKLHRSLELPRIDAEGYHKTIYDMEVTGIDPVEG